MKILDNLSDPNFIMKFYWTFIKLDKITQLFPNTPLETKYGI